jgi:hypothetical protein
MYPLDELRSRLSTPQRDIINTTWSYYREKGYGIPVLTIIEKFGSEAEVRAALENLGGDVIFIRDNEAEIRRFDLTYLGYLLTDQGEELERLLASYLEYIQRQLKNDIEVSSINLQEAMDSLGFSDEQQTFFKEMIYRTPFHGGRSHKDMGVPPNREHWYKAQDMRAYVQEDAMNRYDQNTPIEGGRPTYIKVALPHNFGITQQENAPSEISDSLARFRRDFPDPTKVAFIMMRFGKTPAHINIVNAIKDALSTKSIKALLANDKEYHEDLFYNIQTYMHGCGFGVAVFERIEVEEFNPNVSLEVGYMLALRKPVCFLKDRTLKTLYSDLIGKLYREFEPQNPAETISAELTKWLADRELID